MQSCSIHHCVLLLLTLTFTTAPVAAGDCPTLAKLHQRVTLPCEKECSGEAKWTLKSTRSVVARCDQTSCSSVVKGYEMSHDQYLKGDLSLTITSAEYSMRNTYVCECGDSDHSTVRLSIETVFSAVQKNPGGDLILDLTVPEPVEVIYTSSDSAVGEQICNVTQHPPQCKAEYTHRTSLRYPELTLRDVMYSDSGRYTIRDTKNKEDIRVYSVSVTGLTKGMTALIVLLVLVLVLVISGVIIYKWRESIKVENEERAVYEHMKQQLNLLHYENRRREDQFNPITQKMESIEKNPEKLESKRAEFEKKMKDVNTMIDDLGQRYIENSKYSHRVTLFCNNKRGDLEVCRSLSKTIQNESLLYHSEQVMLVMMMMEGVLDDLENLRQCDSLQSRSSLCTWVDLGLQNIKSWCGRKKNFKEEHGFEANAKEFLSALEKWCEEKEEELQQYKNQSGSAGRSENQSESEPLNRNV